MGFDDGWDIVVWLLIACCILILLTLFGYFIFLAVDSWFLPENVETVKVIGKKYSPARTQMVPVYNPALKTNTMQMQHYSESWDISVKFNNGVKAVASVPKALYKSLKHGDMVNVRYRKGRLSGKYYIVKAWEVLYVRG